MSIFSNFLKLFKYEPTIDAQNTFNIQSALNDNWDKVDDFAKDVSQQLEDKADKQWMPSGWKVEADIPDTYPNFSSIIFETTSVWNGLPSGAIVKTKKGASNWEAIQWLSRDNLKPLYYRVSGGISENTWGKWEKITTESDLVANDLIKATSSTSIFVATTGSDSTGDGTSAKPFATIQKAVNSIPHNMGWSDQIIYLKAGTYIENKIYINNFYNGRLQILSETGTSSDVVINANIVVAETHQFQIGNLTVQGSIEFYNMSGIITGVVLSTNNVKHGIIISRGSQASLYYTSITGRTTGVIADNSSIVSMVGGTITSCNVGIDAGFQSGTGCILMLNGVPNSATTKYKVNYGSVIIEDGVPINSAPKNHTDNLGAYGKGTPNLFGHCSIMNILTRYDYYDGEALSAYQGYILNITKAPKHQSGTTAPTSFVGEGVLYGVHS